MSLKDKTLSTNEITKLKTVINEGIQVNEKIDYYKEGLKESVKALAEELDVKPASINRAIRAAYKADIDRRTEEFDEVSEILDIVGKK